MTWLGLGTALAQGTIGGGGLPEDDGSIVYRNAASPLAFDVDARSSFEFGEDISLGGLDRVLTEISLQLRSDYLQAQGAVVAVYSMDGPGANGLFVPGTKLLERPVNVALGEGTASVALAYQLANTVPDRILVTIRFANPPAGGMAGLVAQESSPTVGSTEAGYWERTGPGESDWALRPLKGNSGADANFIVTVKAAPIPEPGTVMLGLAGVAMIGVTLRRRARP